MITRSLLPLTIILLIAGLAASYSFTTTYMACAARFDAVTREQTYLYAMCDDLADQAVPLGALAYQHLPQVQKQIAALEAAQARLEARTTVPAMADACDELCSIVSNFVGALNATDAEDAGEYTDLRAKLGTTLHQIVIAKAAHAKAVAAYNALLAKPEAAAWRGMMGFAPAEPFVGTRRPIETVFPAVLPGKNAQPTLPATPACAEKQKKPPGAPAPPSPRTQTRPTTPTTNAAPALDPFRT